MININIRNTNKQTTAPTTTGGKPNEVNDNSNKPRTFL